MTARRPASTDTTRTDPRGAVAEYQPEANAAGKKKRGRRPAHNEHWTKVTVVLLDRQIVVLDRLGADIRTASGAAVSRAHIIRALIDALGESDVDLTAVSSEADIKSILTSRFRSKSV
jgi:hypothetical protein